MTTEMQLGVNTSFQPPTEDETLGPTLTWVFVSLRATQGLLAMVGNLVTMIAVYRYEFLWENGTCRMIAALALADFFAGVDAFSGSIVRQFLSRISDLNMLCYFQVITALIAGFGNGYCILLLTIDRFIFITRPLLYVSIVTARRALVAILVTWMVIFFQTNLIMAFAQSPNAKISCEWGNIIPKVAFYLIQFQFAVVTFCVIVPVYGVIWYIAWKLNKNEPDLCHFPPENQDQQRQKLKERKMAKTIGIMLGAYLICYIPMFVYAIMINLFYSRPFPYGIILGYRILTFVYHLQGVVNIFIYGWKNVQFKKAYKKLIPLKWQVSPIIEA